ncbi:MAG: hypothetical protein CMH25_00870 [Micavibrio sp.]|nr:hypothetical protein [Micavibrio sp.]|tara:strand:- start:175243 stop:177714 length:2472 start_codon:yes stop_codon:yes gene_type:complete
MGKRHETDTEKDYKRFINKKRAQTRLILIVENATSAFFPFFCVLLLICGGVLIFQPLFENGTFHKILALTTFLGLLLLFWQSLKALTFPSRKDIDKRLEEVSGYQNAPLFTLDDDLQETERDDDKIALWAYHKHKLFNAIRDSLTSGPPRISFSPKDPYALGVLSVLLLTVGLFIAGENSAARLKQGFFPQIEFIEGAGFEPALQITITPPDYHRAPPQTLSAKQRQSGAFDIAEGSTIQFLYQTKFKAPLLKFDGREDTFNSVEDNLYKLETTPEKDMRLKITQYGFPRYTLPIHIVSDTPPSIALIKKPEVTRDAQILTPIEVSDDIAIEKIRLKISKPGFAENYPDFDAPVFERPAYIKTKGQKQELTEKFDTAEHPWAGKEALLTFEVVDGKGQTGQTQSTILVTLPEKQFRHPLAQRLISLRKQLFTSSLQERIRIAQKIRSERNSLSNYQGDKVIFLALTSSFQRLLFDYDGRATPSVTQILWDVAVKLEDGALGLALKDVQKERQKLFEALNDPDRSEFEKMQAIADLQKALQRLWQEAAKEMQKRMQQMDVSDLTMQQQGFDPHLLNDFMEQMKDEILEGNTQKAEEMFAQLENLLNNLDPANAPQLTLEMREAMEQLAQLDQVIQEQEQLLEETTQCAGNSTNAGTGTNNTPSVNDVRGRQGALEEQVRGMSNSLEQIPEGSQARERLNKAMQKMVEANQALDREDFEAATTAQRKALEALNQLSKDMRQQMAQQFQQNGMPIPFSFGMQPGQRDPFGRIMENGNSMGSDREILPREQRQKRIKGILEELRKRASEQQRPLEEKDYFKRLLQQW